MMGENVLRTTWTKNSPLVLWLHLGHSSWCLRFGLQNHWCRSVPFVLSALWAPLLMAPLLSVILLVSSTQAMFPSNFRHTLRKLP